MDLARDGLVELDGLLSADDVVALRTAVEECVTRPLEPSCVRPNNTLVPLRFADAPVRLILDRAGVVARVAEAARAEDLRWISGYVSLKDAWSGPLAWHQDWWCWGHPVSFRAEPVQVALLCYLDDTDRGNGGLRVLPGSHRRSMPLHDALPTAHDEAEGALPDDHPALSDAAEQVTLPRRAGDAVLFDYRLLHGTHANATPSRRDCVLLSFTPSWRSLPDELRGHLIQHPALPGDDERADAEPRALLPRFDGPRRDLPIERRAPAGFAVEPTA